MKKKKVKEVTKDKKTKMKMKVKAKDIKGKLRGKNE